MRLIVFSRFPKENLSTHQKLFPYPTVMALSASNSPSALSAQALRACDNWQVLNCKNISTWNGEENMLHLCYVPTPSLKQGHLAQKI